MRKKIIITLAFILIVLVAQISVFAADNCTACANSGQSCSTCGPTCKVVSGVCKDTDWWKTAHGFWNGQQSDVANDALDTLEPLIKLIKFVGNMIFVGVTVVLGVKYIWGSVESKSEVKESLTTLIIAALFFYSWDTISSLLKTGDRLHFIRSTAESSAQNVYSIILYICNFLAVGGVVYIGVRYMMAGAEGRSQLKAKGVPIVLGLIMVYATVTFLNLAISIL